VKERKGRKKGWKTGLVLHILLTKTSAKSPVTVRRITGIKAPRK
jgi:hypothetical protein